MTLARERLQALFDHPNVKAFYSVVRRGESSLGAQAYTMISGGGSFSDFSRHPFAGLSTKEGGRAAGAPQFIPSTWAEIAERYSLPDFSPASQDLGYVGCLLKRPGAIEALLAGKFEAAVRICRPEWTSLPGASENNPAWNMDKARALYLDSGGKLDNEELLQPAAPIEDHSPVDLPPVQPKETTMPLPILALISAFGPLIADLIPAVAKAFDRKSETPQKIEAATKIIDTIVTATGTANVQQAVEKMQADPAVRDIAAKAVVTEPQIMGLLEIGGGVEAARKAAADPSAPAFWRQGAFVVAIILTPLIYMTVYRVLWSPDYSEQLRTVVVTAILSGLLGALTGYFFGSMYSSSSAGTTRRATDEVRA
jgi:muramidase (phage lysozyme)